MAKKKTPKKTAKKSAKKERSQTPKIIIFLVLILLFVIVAQNFATETAAPEKKSDAVVAILNGQEFLTDDLVWWYELSVPEQFRETVSQPQFFIFTLVPQILLEQAADEDGIVPTDEEVDDVLGMFLISQGTTEEEFAQELQENGQSIEAVRKSFTVRTKVLQHLEKQGILPETEDLVALDESNQILVRYIETLVNKADIRINALELYQLEADAEFTGNAVCDDDKPVLRMFVSDDCESCKEDLKPFLTLIKPYLQDRFISAHVFNVDSGDDLLTKEIESELSDAEIEIFKEYSKSETTPTVVLGCQYVTSRITQESLNDYQVLVQQMIGE